eukprot:Gb_00684 [translate_table: standard]
MIANGGSISCGGKCHNVKINMGDNNLTTTMYAILVGGVDVVLGVQWLETLGNITMNFKQHCMRFKLEGIQYQLNGFVPPPSQVINFHRMEKLIKKGFHGLIARCYILEGREEQEATPPELQEVLIQHNKVFENLPKELPQNREHDHAIELLSGNNPSNIILYRYLYQQKGEIERLVQELLDAGAIRESKSSFSALVILVRKKDGSFRMCIDYRDLNKITIKDKFSISVIDELLDELNGAILFTRLYLRSGYHQIRVRVEDVYKTTFITHEGHYEFLVMPFGLTNAPATFQGLMNKIFKPYLRKFVLVFFDDILIYSRNWEDHTNHLDKVLQILEDNDLFAKRSKCEFRKGELEYLGHIISGGVKVDLKKIQSILDWPVPKSITSRRGFLGLTGYYRKFVRNYARIAAPLTKFLKKGYFKWNEEANKAFENLKIAMTTTPVLATPDFTKTFTVECDALGQGIGAVLMQEGRPLTFESRKLKGRDLEKSTYEK